MNTTGQLLPPRAGHTTVALGKYLFVFGGFSDEQNLYDDVYVLDMGMFNVMIHYFYLHVSANFTSLPIKDHDALLVKLFLKLTRFLLLLDGEANWKKKVCILFLVIKLGGVEKTGIRIIWY